MKLHKKLHAAQDVKCTEGSEDGIDLLYKGVV